MYFSRFVPKFSPQYIIKLEETACNIASKNVRVMGNNLKSFFKIVKYGKTQIYFEEFFSDLMYRILEKKIYFLTTINEFFSVFLLKNTDIQSRKKVRKQLKILKYNLTTEKNNGNSKIYKYKIHFHQNSNIKCIF